MCSSSLRAVLLILLQLGLYGCREAPKAHVNRAAPDSKKTVCLNMIVKDESAVIERCLASAKPVIDYWVIVDTGSSDGTQKIIREFMKDVPGELHERPWKNFGHNRDEALKLAKGKGDYVLFIDADEYFSYPKDFKWPDLEKDLYHLNTDFSGMQYGRAAVINNHLGWSWKGVLHEYLEGPPGSNSGDIHGIKTVVTTEGFRSKDPQKFQKDAQALEKALVDEPNNTRYVFYLAQSYRDAGMPKESLVNYQKRIAMGGWDQEIFWSMLQVGINQEHLKMAPEVIADSYEKAHAYRPSRAEPLYRLANYERLRENYLESYIAARKALAIPLSHDILFVEKWMYDYGILLEFSIAAYWIDQFEEAYMSSQMLLAQADLPANVRECVERNLVWINKKLDEKLAEEEKNDLALKTLVLIIASDDKPAYVELQKVWKSYMGWDPKHFEVYFIRANPNIASSYEIKEDTITVKAEESYRPGILNKTVLSMEAMASKLKDFDYVLRTNLSSFYVFPNLLKFENSLPRTQCYCGVAMHIPPTWYPQYGIIPFVSGAGIIFSRDLAERMVREKDDILKYSDLPDDVAIGLYLYRKKVPLLHADRVDLPTHQDWLAKKDKIPKEAFHFRAKPHFDFRKADEDYAEELSTLQELLGKYYSLPLAA